MKLESPARSTKTIDEIFERVRERTTELEAKRIESVCREWSPAQHVRRAS